MTEAEHLRPETQPGDEKPDTNADTAQPQEEHSSPGGAGGGGSAASEEPGTKPGTEPTAEPDGDPETAPDPVSALQERVAELEAENSDLKNQYLRKQADMENYRKRMIRDKEDAVSYANQQLLLDLTAIIDDFERAISSAEESRDYDAFHNGVVLIEKQLTGMLERKWGLVRFDSEGTEFDPQKHEAVTTEPRKDHENSMILEEYQKGYMLHDRVLRSAKVKVSMPGAD